MLNELLTVERAARQAGFSMMERDRSIKDAGRKATLVVALDEKGHVSSVRPLAPQVRAWTLRDGQHNSFPFVQPSSPLWKLDARNSWRDEFLRKVKQARRDELLLLEESAQFEISDWPGDTFVRRLRERGKQFASLKETDASVVRTTIGRFLRAVRPKKDRDGQELLKETIRVLLATLKENPQDALIKVAVGLLVGKKNKDKWVCNGALIFEAAGSRFSIVDQSLVNYVSKALMSETDDNEPSVCALTGEPDTPHIGNFPQPTLPAGLGQTWLFAKNKEIPANGRYGRYAAEAMLVGSQTVVRLDAALRELTTTEREDKTWRGVPGEVPKQNDLLLAFVDSVLEAPVAGSLVEEDLSDATTPDSDNDSIGAFEKRTERLIDLVKAKVGNDITKTPVRMILLRKVDQANRKVVYSDTFMVTDLYCAAIHWTKGERNVPQGLSLPVLVKGESRILPPPHVAPLGLIDFTKQIFLRNGERPPGKKKEQVGIPASEVLKFFMTSAENLNPIHEQQVKRVLRLVLFRRTWLLENVAHVQHTPRSWNRRDKEEKRFDNREALRTLTILGVILNKLQRTKEVYMNETAFKLGQLLAAADLVHAGYCADVRGGAVPSSLLGNQVFTMAQTAPAKALALFSSRWKPYDGWISRKIRSGYEPPDRLLDENGKLKQEKDVKSKEDKQELRKAWAIKNAMYQRSKAADITAELTGSLPTRCDDVFRAELLLGYITGIPWKKTDDSNSQQTDSTKED